MEFQFPLNSQEEHKSLPLSNIVLFRQDEVALATNIITMEG